MMIMILMNIDDCQMGAVHNKSVIYGFKIIVKLMLEGVPLKGPESQNFPVGRF